MNFTKYSKCPTCGFATIYEKANQSNGGTSQRRIRPDQIITNEHGQFQLSVCRGDRSTIYSFTKIPQELQGELLLKEG